MGNAESQGDGSGAGVGNHEDEEHLAECETLGYRVLGVQPNSPASSAGLVSFLDFLVGCDGRMLLADGEDDDEGDVDFVQVLKDSVSKELELLVYNIKSQQTRLVNMTPRRDWGGKGLIGVTIRLDDYAGADERLIRVLSVEDNSPAAIAGLHPLTDYLLGTATVSFASSEVLGAVLREHQDRPVEFYVYNTSSDVVRIVTLLPTYSWGGEGLLGAEVGTGYLHRLPHECRSTDGSSVEVRVVRTVTPRDFISGLEGGGGGAGAGADGADGAGLEGAVPGENIMVDLTAEDDGEDGDKDRGVGVLGDDGGGTVGGSGRPGADPPLRPEGGSVDDARVVSEPESEPEREPEPSHLGREAGAGEPRADEGAELGPVDPNGAAQSDGGGDDVNREYSREPSELERGGDGSGDRTAVVTATTQQERNDTPAPPRGASEEAAAPPERQHASGHCDAEASATAPPPPPAYDDKPSSSSAAASFFSLPPMPSMPFRSGTFTPPVSIAGGGGGGLADSGAGGAADGAGASDSASFFPPPPMSQLATSSKKAPPYPPSYAAQGPGGGGNAVGADDGGEGEGGVDLR